VSTWNKTLRRQSSSTRVSICKAKENRDAVKQFKQERVQLAREREKIII